jgi:hypothetical protein
MQCAGEVLRKRLMSLADTFWLLPVLGGLALGAWLRWTAVSLLLGLAFFVLTLMLFGYSLDHYENGDCQAGAPCPIGEHVIEYALPIALLLGCTLVLGGFGRTVWSYVSQRREWRRRRA